MNVSINTDPEFTKTDRQNKIGGFSTDTRQFDEIIQIVWHLGVKFIHELSAEFYDVLSFLSKETYGIDGLFNDLKRKFGHCLGGISQAKESSTCLACDLIFGPRAQYSCNKNPERIFFLGDLANCRFFVFFYFPLKNSYDFIDVYTLFLSQSVT